MRANKRDSSYSQGREISLDKLVCLLIKYPEVITNLNFIHISIFPLDFRTGTEEKDKIQFSVVIEF